MVWLPLIVFFCIYGVLGGIGSLLLFFQVEPFTSIYLEHSGIVFPVMSVDERQTFLLILLGSPIFLFLGYSFTIFLLKKLRVHLTISSDLSLPAWMAHLIFYCFFFFAVNSLMKSSAFSGLGSWGSYSQWINLRVSIFNSLSFFEFTNIYRWLPCLSALVILMPVKTRMEAIARWFPIFLTIIIDFCMYQKIPLLLTLVMGIGSLFLQTVFRDKTRIPKISTKLAISIFGLIMVYLVAVFLPSLGTKIQLSSQYLLNKQAKEVVLTNESKMLDVTKSVTTQLAREDISNKEDTDKSQQQPPQVIMNQSTKSIEIKKITSASANPLLTSSIPAIYIFKHPLTKFKYSVFTLFSRLTGPLIYYPVVFPKMTPFYSIDFGQDILGLGNMPNDNQVIWHAMYPNDTGCAAAPVNFVFYSQGGLFVCFIGMGLVGILLGFFWYFILNASGGIRLRSMVATTLILFTMQLGIDSIRNAMIVSYGYFWALLLIVGLYYISVIMNRIKKNYFYAGTI